MFNLENSLNRHVKKFQNLEGNLKNTKKELQSTRNNLHDSEIRNDHLFHELNRLENDNKILLKNQKNSFQLEKVIARAITPFRLEVEDLKSELKKHTSLDFINIIYERLEIALNTEIKSIEKLNEILLNNLQDVIADQFNYRTEEMKRRIKGFVSEDRKKNLEENRVFVENQCSQIKANFKGDAFEARINQYVAEQLENLERKIDEKEKELVGKFQAMMKHEFGEFLQSEVKTKIESNVQKQHENLVEAISQVEGRLKELREQRIREECLQIRKEIEIEGEEGSQCLRTEIRSEVEKLNSEQISRMNNHIFELENRIEEKINSLQKEGPLVTEPATPPSPKMRKSSSQIRLNTSILKIKSEHEKEIQNLKEMQRSDLIQLQAFREELNEIRAHISFESQGLRKEMPKMKHEIKILKELVNKLLKNQNRRGQPHVAGGQ